MSTHKCSWRWRYYLYQTVPQSLTADAEYGSQENYELLSNKGIYAYVKFGTFYKEQNVTGKKRKTSPFYRDQVHYNEKEDHYICSMGQPMEKISGGTKTIKSDYGQTYSKYRAKNCTGCPLREKRPFCREESCSWVLQSNELWQEWLFNDS